MALKRKAWNGELDFVIHNGDIAYADNHYGERNGTVYMDWMSAFYHNVSSYSSRVPYMLSAGNHEATCAYQEYKVHAAMNPYRASYSPSPMYYSYQHGKVFVVALSAEQGLFTNVSSPEMRWLKSTLKRAHKRKQRGQVAWVVSHVHYPMKPVGYCTYQHNYCCAGPECGAFTEAFTHVEDLFARYQVDVHFTAHEHVYERTLPMYRFSPEERFKDQEQQAGGDDPSQAWNSSDLNDFADPQYPMYVTIGSPGDVEIFAPLFFEPAPIWSVARSRATNFGFGLVNASETQFSFQYEAAQSASPGNVNPYVLDSFTITRSAEGQRRRTRAVEALLGPASE